MLEREVWLSALAVAGVDVCQRLLTALEDRSGEQYRTMRKGKALFQAELLLFQVAVDVCTLVKAGSQASPPAVYWVSPPSAVLPIKAINRLLAFEAGHRHLSLSACVHFFIEVRTI